MRRTTGTIFVAVLAGLAAAPAAEHRPARRDAVDRYREHFFKGDGGDPKGGAVRVTFLGVATLLFDDGQTQLLTDGFLSRPSLIRVGAGRLRTDTEVVDAALKRAKADRVKALFVAHSHYDHAFDVAYIARKTGATIHGSASTLNIGRGGDVPEGQLVRFEPGKEYKVGQFSVTVLAGKHSPAIRFINNDLGQTIDKPLRQPAGFKDYKEGGAFDFLIRHGENTMLVNAAGNYSDGALDKVRADVLFLSVGALDLQTDAFRDTFYDNTVKKVRPRLVIPVHWDDFFTPLTDNLEGWGRFWLSFDFLIGRLKADGIRFGILQGFQSVTLFEKAAAPKKR